MSFNRIIFGYARRCSASAMFAENGVRDFNALRRNSIVSLISRLCTSTNEILVQILNSELLVTSSLYKNWCELLSGGEDLRDFIITQSILNSSVND